MKKQYPTREKSRWEHALQRPLRGVEFEMLELMRMDLFEYLDVLTTCPYDDKKSNRARARDLDRVAVRLAEMTPRRAKALHTAIKAGRIEFSLTSEESSRPMPIAWDLQKYWESVQQ